MPKLINKRPSPGDDWIPYTLNMVVNGRRWIEDGNVSQWEYFRGREGDDPNPDPYPAFFPEEMRVMVKTPEGDLSRHYFTIWPASYPEAPDSPLGTNITEYSLPYTRRIVDPRPHDGPRYLSSETIDCPLTGGGCIIDDPVNPVWANLSDYDNRSRKTYLAYELDDTNTNHDGFGLAFNKNRRVRSSRVRFDDDSGRYIQKNFSNFDGLGNYRTVETETNFANTPDQKVFVDYNPGQNYPGGYTPPPISSTWILGTFQSTRKTQGVGSGATYRHSKVTFDNKGRMTCLRKLKRSDVGGAGALSSDDVLQRFYYDGLGNLKTHTWVGAFGTTLGTNSSAPCEGLLGTNSYRMEHTYEHGQRATSRYTEADGSVAGGSALDFYVLDRDIDQNTGLPRSIRDTAGLETDYLFDKQSRLTAVQPEPASGAAWRSIKYTKASGSTGAKIVVDDRPNGATSGSSLAHEEYIYDDLGRLAKEKRKMPSGSGSADSSREFRYHAGGNLLSKTVWSFGTSPNKTEYLNYDAWGRYRRIRQPDGVNLTADEEEALRVERGISPEDDFFTPASHDIDITYEGVSHVKRERYVRVNPDNQLDPNSETTVETDEFYDAFGRLTLMREFSGATTYDTVYQYDVGDHLVEAKQRLPNGLNQIRTWTWNQLDFMSHECPPEKDGCMYYGAIDALGRVNRTKDGNQPDGVQDLRLRYDRAGRLTTINEKKGDKRPLKLYQYGTQNIGDNWAKGKLVFARNHHYFEELGDTELRVEEDYQYRGTSGRPSWKRTTWLQACRPWTDPDECPPNSPPGTFDTESVFDYSEVYDALGNTTTISYPNCVPGTKECVPEPFTIYNDYQDGFLTEVTGPGRDWATDITYHDNQMLAGFRHSNGIWDHHGKDPQGMPRVNSIYTTGPASWSTGTYNYDGSGNIDGIGTQRFLYDRVNRLKEASLEYPAAFSLGDDPETNSLNATSNGFLSTTQRYTYDVPGNIKTIWTDWVTQSFNVNPLTNRLNAPVEYDPSGNVTKWRDDRNVETTFAYDFFNRQESRSTAEANSTWYYLYTVDDERFFRHNPGGSPETFLTVRDFGGRPLREFITRNGELIPNKQNIYLGNTLLASVIRPVDGELNDERHYTVDHLGTPRMVTTNAPVQVVNHDYYPFGEEIPHVIEDNLPMKFTGHERDFFGPSDGDDLDYMHARYCSPFTGRFLSVDPIGGVPGSPQSWNRYAYVQNGPMNAVDPTGMAKVCTGNGDSKKCVFVDGDGDGDTSDDDLTLGQIEDLSGAYGEFIAANDGADLGNSGTGVRGGTEEDRSLIRAASQFVGATLEGGWGNITIALSKLREGEAGQLNWKRIYPAEGGYTLSIDPAKANHRSNPSSVARTLTHEYLHRSMKGIFSHNAAHRGLDDRAKRHIKKFGLAGKGCPAQGGATGLFGFGPQFYSGC